MINAKFKYNIKFFHTITALISKPITWSAPPLLISTFSNRSIKLGCFGKKASLLKTSKVGNQIIHTSLGTLKSKATIESPPDSLTLTLAPIITEKGLKRLRPLTCKLDILRECGISREMEYLRQKSILFSYSEIETSSDWIPCVL